MQERLEYQEVLMEDAREENANTIIGENEEIFVLGNDVIPETYV